ncbi:MAG: CmcJ/NvfI family oxidoreductase [Gammaproteobacteria bacterium]
MTRSITGKLTFLAAESPTPVYRASVGGAEARLDISGEYEDLEVDVINARLVDETFALDEQGFQLVPHRTSVADLFDTDERESTYERECCDLVIAATGASRAQCFDHTLRSSDPDRRAEKRVREPTSVIHNDYTPRSGPQRVRDLMGAEAEALLEKPFAIVNVWRPLRPVRTFPLALCDARTVADDDLVAAERRAKDRIGELFMVRYNSGQRWHYFPDMTESEVLLIKTFDSRDDGRARWCVHTALVSAAFPEDAPPRESIETRVFAFFDDDGN